jgi:transcriptional regulator with XRE-family HTH domain
MAKSFDELTKGWSAKRLAKVEARAQQLIAEEMTLRDLRRAHALTQAQLAKTLGIGQEHISRLEQKSDMLLSTLASYVRAMGGDLRLIAEFPDRPPVALASFADVFEPATPRAKTRRSRKKSAIRTRRNPDATSRRSAIRRSTANP